MGRGEEVERRVSLSAAENTFIYTFKQLVWQEVWDVKAEIFPCSRVHPCALYSAICSHSGGSLSDLSVVLMWEHQTQHMHLLCFSFSFLLVIYLFHNGDRTFKGLKAVEYRSWNGATAGNGFCELCWMPPRELALERKINGQMQSWCIIELKVD